MTTRQTVTDFSIAANLGREEPRTNILHQQAPDTLLTEVSSLGRDCDGTTVYYCPICKYYTTRSNDMRRHLLTHSGERPFRCDLCGKTFTQSSHMTAHRRVHTRDKPYKRNEFPCRSSSSQQIKTHLSIQEDEMTTRQTSREEPRTNTSQQEPTGTLFQCGSCQKAFTTALYLDEHQKLCSARNGPGLPVPTDLTSLGRDCDGVIVYHCPYCKYNITNRGNMRRHLVTHTGTRPFQCDVYRKRFKRAYDLTRHHLVHTREKTYKCAKCSYSSTYRSNLKLHVSKHMDEAMFTCSECSFSTADRCVMIRHTRTHTGENPYKCHHIEYSPKWKDLLTKHIGRIHKYLIATYP